jgi:hypothetical protein
VPVTASAAPPAHAVHFRNLRKRDRSASTLAGIFPMPAVRSCSPLLSWFCHSFPSRFSRRGFSAGWALIGASTDMVNFIEQHLHFSEY